MKLEVGQFARLKSGYICKIININDFREPNMKYGVEANYLKDVMFIGDDDVVKASYNIIDILEVGDYANGCYVSNKRASVNEHLGGHPKEIGIIKCNAYFNQGNYNDCKFEWIEEQDIKSIVTHEQMEQMAYKVGD